LIGLFKQRNPILWLALLLYAVAVKWIYFTWPQSVAATPTGGHLFKPILEFFAGEKDSSLQLRFIGLLLNLVQAFQLNGLINRNKMMGAATYLPALSYLTLSSFFSQWNDFTSWSLVLCLLLWIFQGQFKLYQTPQSRGAVYNRCLIWGLLPLLEPAALPFVLWGLIGIWVMRPFRWPEFWIVLMGLITPYYFMMIWNYWNGVGEWYRVVPSLRLYYPHIGEARWFVAMGMLLAIPTLVGMGQVQSNLRKMLIPVRKGWMHWTIWLLLSLLLPFLLPQQYGPGYTAILLPTAAFQACFYYYTGLRIVPLLFFWLELGAVLWLQYGSRIS